MTPFLKAFQHFAGKTEIPAVAAHSYSGPSEGARLGAGTRGSRFSFRDWIFLKFA